MDSVEAASSFCLQSVCVSDPENFLTYMFVAYATSKFALNFKAIGALQKVHSFLQLANHICVFVFTSNFLLEYPTEREKIVEHGNFR